MTTDPRGLTVDEARNRCLSALIHRWPAVSFRIREDATLIREFGWVFTIEIANVADAAALTAATPIPRLALVNRTTAQTVGTARAYTPERLAGIFEDLLAASLRNGRNWCLTFRVAGTSRPKSIAETARDAGVEELAPALEQLLF